MPTKTSLKILMFYLPCWSNWLIKTHMSISDMKKKVREIGIAPGLLLEMKEAKPAALKEIWSNENTIMMIVRVFF